MNIKNKRIYLYKIIKSIYQIISVYLAAVMFILPIQLYCFNEFEPISFISNIVVTPLFTFFLLLGYITLVLIFIPFLSDILIHSNYILLKLIISISQIIQSFNHFTISTISPNIISIIGYYFLIFMSRIKKYYILIFKRKHLKLSRIITKILTIVVVICIIFNYLYIKYFENYVIYFNVEQGNMAFIRYNMKNIVIDIGSTTSNIASSVILNHMKKNAYDKIDILILSHMHSDHVNGVLKVIDNVKVDTVIYPLNKTKLEKEYFDILDKLKKKNISTIICTQYDKITYDNITIDILSPPLDGYINAGDKVNSNSLVSLITIKENSLLFMGDATKESEEYIFNNLQNYNTDVNERLKRNVILQVGHHGSKTSTSDILLKELNIKKAIISSKKEKYGHPSEDTLDILRKYRINYKITQINGAIKINLK